jgi:membrane protease YdiL (CAAX protease family)
LEYISGWVYIWQAAALAVAAPAFLRRKTEGKIASVSLRLSIRRTLREKKEWLALGALAGLGLWLAGAFLISLLDPATTASARAPSFLNSACLFVGILIAPWAEEIFYRRQLPSRLTPRLGETGAMLSSVLLFAFLQLNPLLILPALLLGAANTLLTLRSGSLMPAILAHTVFNLLALFLGFRLSI